MKLYEMLRSVEDPVDAVREGNSEGRKREKKEEVKVESEEVKEERRKRKRRKRESERTYSVEDLMEDFEFFEGMEVEE